MSIQDLLDQLSQQGVQLWYEGTRLRFRAPRGALTSEQRAWLIERRGEVVAALRQRADVAVRRAPLSYTQRSLWFVNREEPASSAYNVAFAVHVASAIDVAALREALQALVDRHGSLRTVYEVVDGEPCQSVAGAGVAAFTVEQLAELDDAALAARLDADYKRPFDLEHGPLMRTSLYSRGPADHVLLMCAHHIAVDGWSLLLLLEELRALYLEFTTGQLAALPRPDVQYTDYVEWQARMLTGEEGERLGRYWQAKLAAPRAVIDLPCARPRPPRRSVRGATFDFELDAALGQRLSQLARDEGTTLFVLLLAAFKILLFRYTGTDDIVVGTPTLGRSQPEFRRTVGHFVNPVPLRSLLDPQMTGRALMASVRQTLIEVLEGQEYPLALMVERLHERRDPSRSPLFETIFILQRFEQFRELTALQAMGPLDPLVDFAGLNVRRFAIRQQEGQFDLSLGLVERGDVLLGAFKYNTELFDAATVRQLSGHYIQLLRAIVEQPDACIGELPLLTEADRGALLHAAGDRRILTEAEASTLHARFERQAAHCPHVVAVTGDGTQLTYGELNRRANRLAHRLLELGVGRDSLVGLCAERSLDLVVAIVAVLKAGGAYLPIDLAYPPDRIAFMLADAAAPVLLTQRALLERLPAHSGATVFLDDDLSAYPEADPPPAAQPDDLAYVIYTSGSTGTPKGTMLTHRAVDRLFTSTADWYRFDAGDVWTLFHSVAFDFSVWELWGALLHGGRLVIVPFMVSRSPEVFRELLDREGVTVLNQTPSAFRQLIQADLASGPARLTRLRHVIFGGEALDPQSLRPWFDRYGDTTPALVNMYGITETCVHVTYRPITLADLDAGGGSVIGVPIPDLRVHVLDGQRQLVPANVPGEMYVGGPGLARGYLHQPELTAARFVADPFIPGERLYRTGDLAMRRLNGELEYLGRIDDQVKIRGFRIEPDEIASILCQFDRVREAVVLAISHGENDQRLVAYVVAGMPVPAVSELRLKLSKAVPDYMVPSSFVFLEKLPLTSNGKIDRGALPAPSAVDIERSDGFQEPESETERIVAAVFADVLGVPAVSVHDNFFEIGGHSLLATRALARLRERFKSDVPLRALFEAPTVYELSRWLERTEEDKQSLVNQRQWKCLVPVQSNRTGSPLFVVAGYFDQEDTLRILANFIPYLSSEQPLCGLRPRWVDGRSPSYSSVEEMVDEYVSELRAFQPKGPYYLIGDCVGGVVAVEMARRLLEEGDEIALLALIDTERPQRLSVVLHSLNQAWARIHHIAHILRRFIRPTEGTRLQVITDVLNRKLRKSGLSSIPITPDEHIYEQRLKYQRLMKKHRLQRYPGPLKLIVSEDLYRFFWLLGWNGFADGGVEVYRTPGNHQTFRFQYGKEFGLQLRRCVDRARSEITEQVADVAGSAGEGDLLTRKGIAAS